MNKCHTGHVSTNENMANIATKIFPWGMKQSHLVGMLLHDIEDEPDDETQQQSNCWEEIILTQ
jgi:hypothetical protein